MEHQVQHPLRGHQRRDLSRCRTGQGDGNRGEEQFLVGHGQAADHHAQRSQQRPGFGRDRRKGDDPACRYETLCAHRPEEVPPQGKEIVGHPQAQHPATEEQQPGIEQQQPAEADGERLQHRRFGRLHKYRAPVEGKGKKQGKHGCSDSGKPRRDDHVLDGGKGGFGRVRARAIAPSERERGALFEPDAEAQGGPGDKVAVP